MNKPLIAIYCASSSKIDNIYLHDAKKVGKLLTEAGYGIKYGGGSIGSMGAISNEVLANNGRVVGVIPQFMMDLEWAHPEVKEMIVTQTMAQRKEILIADVEAILVMAGGVGTLDELFDAMSLKKLGKFHKPIIILNTNNFFSPLFEILNKSIDEQFMRNEHRELWQVAQTPEEVLPLIKNTPQWSNNAISFASV